MIQYDIKTDVVKTSPLTKQIEVTLIENSVIGETVTATGNEYMFAGELAHHIVNQHGTIFDQKRVTDDVKQEKWTAFCYVLKLAYMAGYDANVHVKEL
jgi:hypothetical protein